MPGGSGRELAERGIQAELLCPFILPSSCYTRSCTLCYPIPPFPLVSLLFLVAHHVCCCCRFFVFNLDTMHLTELSRFIDLGTKTMCRLVSPLSKAVEST